MSDASTKQMATAYSQTAPKSRFLTSMFQAPPQNYFNSEKIEFDIDRDDAEIAIVGTR